MKFGKVVLKLRCDMFTPDRQTDGRTDGQTERQTDGRTPDICIQ